MKRLLLDAKTENYITTILFSFRIDSDDDRRISLEEFTSDKIKSSLETWVGPIEDMEAEFNKIDQNGGGQVNNMKY